MSSKGKLIRAILADDHPLLRLGFKTVFLLNEKIHMITQVANGKDLVAAVDEHTPDLVITDIEMVVMDGLDATRLIKAKHPGIKVIVLSHHAEGELIDEAIEAGADGYLIKSVQTDELFKAIDSVMEGKTSFCSKSLEIFLKRKRKLKSQPKVRLSKKETEVLCLIAMGKSSAAISKLLFISIRTVEFHRQSLKNKLGVDSIAGITAYAYRHGYVKKDPE